MTEVLKIFSGGCEFLKIYGIIILGVLTLSVEFVVFNSHVSITFTFVLLNHEIAFHINKYNYDYAE
ncbi:MAG TPA: hypothetical protein ENN33_09780 [Ignavibacteria bacterium]|nr:hypothetical protein [Ignavibacteria bacterium]